MVERIVDPLGAPAEGEREVVETLEPPPRELEGPAPLPARVDAPVLAALAEQLALATGDTALAGRLNEALQVLEPSEASGRLLLRLLGDQVALGSFDEHGVHCRREAVRALLRLGFPWALEIDPETLEWFRQAEAPKGRRSRWLAVALVTALAALGAGGYLALQTLEAPASGLQVPAKAVKVLAPRLAREAGLVVPLFQGCIPTHEPGQGAEAEVTLHLGSAGEVASTDVSEARPDRALPAGVRACVQRAASGLGFEAGAPGTLTFLVR